MNNIIKAPASKSYLQRALAISALAKGTTVLQNISWCNDAIAAKNIIENLGATIKENNRNLTIISDGLNLKALSFSAGESGLSVRMFSPILALSNKEIIFTGEGSLKTRPIQIIDDALSQLAAKIETNNGLLPITIKGPIKSGIIEIDGSLSSQLLTGLLIALPLVEGNSVIKVQNLKSIPYIDMTLSIIKEFGVEIENDDYKIFRIKGNQKYNAANYNIEGDWSAAAFFLVLGAVNGKIIVENLNSNSLQADKEILTVLRKSGAEISIKENTIIVNKKELNAFDFDATNCPDLFPPIVCLAAECKGKSTIKGVLRLIHKESNRARVLKQEFAKIGINITLDGDLMHITGGKLKSGIINSHNDHRIAMAAGIMNLFTDKNIEIENQYAVNKSYPEFFKDLEKLQ
jgi:3-phosphoshikimate 1-carboxyvinyltransferase